MALFFFAVVIIVFICMCAVGGESQRQRASFVYLYGVRAEGRAASISRAWSYIAVMVWSASRSALSLLQTTRSNLLESDTHIYA